MATITGITLGGVTKAKIGLGNAENTSDMDKPVSTAQQVALDLKVPTSALRSIDAVIFYTGSAYPLRSTVTSDSLRRVRWVGTVAPTIGGGYAISGLDVWEKVVIE